MSLSRLSSDNLAHVTRYLTPYVVYSLIFCGSRDLNARLLAETSILEFELGLHSPFPFSAYQFRRLRHLRVSMKEGFRNIPLSLNGASMFPLEPVKSLVKLSLFVPQSFAILSSSEANSRLSECFPNLEVLRLGGSISSALERAQLERLPRQLRDLTISVHSLPRSSMPMEWIEAMPPNLERLSLPSFSLTEEAPGELSSTIAWPPGLTKLRVGCLPRIHHLRALPKGLTKFVGAIKAGGTAEDVLMSSLPSSLTHLCVNQAYNTAFVLDVPLNSHMKFCRVQAMMLPGGQRPNPGTIDSISIPLEAMPKTLKTMSGIQLAATPENIAQLPRALERLILGRMFRGFTNYAALPQLTALSITDDAMEGVDVPYEALPGTLTYLASSFTKESQLEKLPGSLLDLRLSSRRDNLLPYLGPNALFKLPRSLTSLAITLASFSSREALLGMPPIKKLIFLPRPCASPIGIDPVLMKVLPTSLEYLRLAPAEQLAPLNAWVHDLQRFDKLRTLWVRPNSQNPDVVLYNCKILTGLPNTITKLYILTEPSWTTHSDLFDHLPPGLLFLQASVMYYEEDPMPFTDQHFTKLPRSLTSLSINPTQAISGVFFQTAPPHLTSIDFGSTTPDFMEAKRAYYQQPQWEGFPPEAIAQTTPLED